MFELFSPMQGVPCIGLDLLRLLIITLKLVRLRGVPLFARLAAEGLLENGECSFQGEAKWLFSNALLLNGFV